MTRYALRVDANQAAVVSALEAAGATVQIVGKPLDHFDLTCPKQRYEARKAGHDVPKHKPAGIPKPWLRHPLVNWKCANCGILKLLKKTDARNTYCSKSCGQIAFNKNKEKPQPLACKVCNQPVKGKPSDGTVFCSYACFGISRKNATKDQRTKQCFHCNAEYLSSPSQKRIYCSYQCHVESGGGWRAGQAAMKAIMKYGAKKDANHNEIVDALKAAGASVIDMSHVGGGFPDLICGYAGVTLLVEIKNLKTAYGRRGLNKNQIRWESLWKGGPLSIVDSPEAALRVLKVMAA